MPENDLAIPSRLMVKPELTWREPRWAYVSKLWRQLRCLLNPTSLIRISLVTAFLAAVIVWGLKWVMPQVILPNLWPLLLALPGILLLLILQTSLLTLIPPTATVRPDKICVQHSESMSIVDAASIARTYIIVFSNQRIRLRICYLHKEKCKSLTIGVPPTVDLERLAELLPVWPIVRDARSWPPGSDGLEPLTIQG
jgi:hypothetical protein